MSFWQFFFIKLECWTCPVLGNNVLRYFSRIQIFLCTTVLSVIGLLEIVRDEPSRGSFNLWISINREFCVRIFIQ